jgi:CRP/FNR family cyclic AMP-dependent transcriptional regulator
VCEILMFNNQKPWKDVRRSGANIALTPLSQQECVELMSHVPLFCELSRRQLRRLAGAALQRTYPAGTIIVRPGEPGVGLYVLISGGASVQQESTDGNPRQLALLGAGDFFGEMALLDISPRSASVTAEEDTRALVVPIFDFRTLLHDDVDIAVKLLAVLSRRVRTVQTTASA